MKPVFFNQEHRFSRKLKKNRVSEKKTPTNSWVGEALGTHYVCGLHRHELGKIMSMGSMPKRRECQVDQKIHLKPHVVPPLEV